MPIKSKYLYLCTKLSILLFLLTSCNHSQHKPYRLVKAFDGDSMLITDYDCKVQCKNLELRLLGIDAPEFSQDPWGKRAKEFLLSQIQDAKIYIETDFEPHDKYGRTLVYLFYANPSQADEAKNIYKLKFLNQELLERGYAEIFLLDSNLKYADKLKLAEYQAKNHELNIWSKQDGLKISPYKYRKAQKCKR